MGFDPYRDPYGSSERSGLDSKVKDRVQGIGGLLLWCGVYMGIDVESKSCAVMPKHSADGFDVHAVLQGKGGKSVSEVMEADLWQSGPV